MTKIKKRRIALIFVSLLGLTLLSCINQKTSTEKYCGYELTDDDLKRVESELNNSYEYPDKDLDILTDITTEVKFCLTIA